MSAAGLSAKAALQKSRGPKLINALDNRSYGTPTYIRRAGRGRAVATVTHHYLRCDPRPLNTHKRAHESERQQTYAVCL